MPFANPRLNPLFSCSLPERYAKATFDLFRVTLSILATDSSQSRVNMPGDPPRLRLYRPATNGAAARSMQARSTSTWVFTFGIPNAN